MKFLILLTVIQSAFLIWTVDAQSQMIFRMDDSPSAVRAGWPAEVGPSVTYTKSHVVGGGPYGENAYRFIQHHTGNSVRDYGGEFYWGWNGNIEPADPAQGSSRFYRFRIWFSADTNFNGLYWQDGSNTRLGNKLLMVGDGCGRNRCRAILGYRGGGSDGSRLVEYIRLQLDGGEDPTEVGPLQTGVWYNVQIEIDSSSTVSLADGAFRIWLDNNNQLAPSAQRTGIILNPVNWRYVFLGAYNNNGLASDGVHHFQISSFEVSSQFDPSWHRPAGNSPVVPRQPRNLRISP